MNGETNLSALIRNMEPFLNEGDYVFCLVETNKSIPFNDVLYYFREKEAVTIVVRKEYADAHQLSYHYISSWITLRIHSALEAVGLTAAFSKALADEGISCNVVAAYFHDHIFIAKADALKAIEALHKLSEKL
ncbi:MAG: ACT domain-containing protein [Chitinophagaceae bacterium]